MGLFVLVSFPHAQHSHNQKIVIGLNSNNKMCHTHVPPCGSVALLCCSNANKRKQGKNSYCLLVISWLSQ